MKRLAIVSTHPIQYNAPLFRLLASAPETSVHVFFTKEEAEFRHDAEFGQEVTWDIPLTEGYAHSTYPCSSTSNHKNLLHAIERFSAHAILIFGWNPPGHLQTMRHFHGQTPIWFRGDSILNSGTEGWKRLFRRIGLRWIYRHVDHAFPVGKCNRAYFLWAGITRTQLTMAPHAVDHQFFSRDDQMRREEAQQVRSNLGIRDEDTVFLFAGKLNANKQPVQLAHAFLQMEGKAALASHLIFVGAGPLEADMKRQFGGHPRVHFAGFQNQSRMPIWYRVANILCLVSISETWGLAVNEALICGCRVMASDTVGCVPDLVAPSKAHSIVPHDRSNEWPRVLDHMATTHPSLPPSENHLLTARDVFLHQLHHETA